ncbi:NAD(P)-binding protein [Xylariaceae sp. AK1471]|nr:NAD(P)-binding protein [Xylariaceae sp. AK1471]
MPSNVEELIRQLNRPYTGTNFAQPLHHQVPESRQASNLHLPSPFVAVITGCSKGIGRASAQVFAQAGATGLILTARTLSAELEETKALCEAAAASKDLKVSILSAPAGDEASAERIRSIIETEHGGRLDLLVNNAGIVSTDASAARKLVDISPDQISIPISTNYIGRFLTMRALIPVLLSTDGGNGAKMVINITSICSHFTDYAALGFNISEVASNRLTEIAAEMYRDQGLLCYSLHPGFVLTSPPPGVGDEPGFLDQSSDDRELCGSFMLWLVRKSPAWLSGRYLSAQWDTDELERKREEIVADDKLKARMVV